MKQVYFWIRLLLSGGLIVLLFYTVDLQDVSAAIIPSNVSYLLAAFALGMADRIFMAYKWNILLKAKAIVISLNDTAITYLATTFLGLFLPATVGGDMLRAYAVSRKGYRVSDIVSSIVVERILGLIALATFGLGSIALSIWVFGQSFFVGIWDLFWTILVIGMGVSALLLISLNESLLHLLASLVRKWNKYIPGHKLLKKVRDVYQSYLSYRHNRVELIAFLLLSFVENLFPILWSYCLSLAFNVSVPLLYLFILVPIVLILKRLPISIDGIGIHEGTFVYFLSLIGIARSEALLLGIVTHLFTVAVVLPGGILYAFNGFSIRRGVKEKVLELQSPG